MEDYKDLVNQAKNYDKEAFAELYRMVYQDMYRFALYTLKNQQDAEDAVGDTITDAFATIQKLRSATAFRSWIFKILSNKCRQKLKEYLHKTAELTDDLVHTADFSEDSEVRAAFANLENEERLIIMMHIFGGYSSREIGKILHKSDNTVRSSKSRALKKLERQLSE